MVAFCLSDNAVGLISEVTLRQAVLGIEAMLILAQLVWYVARMPKRGR